MLVWNTGDFGKEEQVPQKGRGRCWDIECQAEKSVFFYMQLETFKQCCFFLRKIRSMLAKMSGSYYLQDGCDFHFDFRNKLFWLICCPNEIGSFNI